MPPIDGFLLIPTYPSKLNMSSRHRRHRAKVELTLLVILVSMIWETNIEWRDDKPLNPLNLSIEIDTFFMCYNHYRFRFLLRLGVISDSLLDRTVGLFISIIIGNSFAFGPESSLSAWFSTG